MLYFTIDSGDGFRVFVPTHDNLRLRVMAVTMLYSVGIVAVRNVFHCKSRILLVKPVSIQLLKWSCLQRLSPNRA